VRFLTKRLGIVSFRAAWEPPRPEAALVAVLTVFAVLSLAGVSLPPDGLPELVPALAGASALIAVLYRQQSGVGIMRHEGSNFLLWVTWRGNRVLDLDELASVTREPAGALPALTLTDIRRETLTIPLGRWKDEEQLLAEIDRAISETGSSGSVGNAVPVRKPRWVRPARATLIAATFALFLVIR
jgi:hypothetical protein